MHYSYSCYIFYVKSLPIIIFKVDNITCLFWYIKNRCGLLKLMGEKFLSRFTSFFLIINSKESQVVSVIIFKFDYRSIYSIIKIDGFYRLNRSSISYILQVLVGKWTIPLSWLYSITTEDSPLIIYKMYYIYFMK